MTLTTKRLWFAPDLSAHFGVSDSTLHKWVREGKLPKPQYLNGRRCWLSAQVVAAEEAMLTTDNTRSKPPLPNSPAIRRAAMRSGLRASFKKGKGWAFAASDGSVWETDPEKRMSDSEALSYLGVAS
ncbi:helix-turn-helix transcriptional regulator [Neptuniibacter sp.]|uniref:helix-turn-helix transcriptional regulator n=1 Tax=Neptuniibacter sp. TaxID=1962643 RepID=UPI003B5ABD69